MEGHDLAALLSHQAGLFPWWGPGCPRVCRVCLGRWPLWQRRPRPWIAPGSSRLGMPECLPHTGPCGRKAPSRCAPERLRRRWGHSETSHYLWSGGGVLLHPVLHVPAYWPPGWRCAMT